MLTASPATRAFPAASTTASRVTTHSNTDLDGSCSTPGCEKTVTSVSICAQHVAYVVDSRHRGFPNPSSVGGTSTGPALANVEGNRTVMVMLANAAYAVSAYEMRGIGRLWSAVRRVCRSIAVGFSSASIERSRMGSRGIRDGLENERRRGGMQTENRSNEEGNDTIPNGDDKGSHLTGSTDMYYSNFTGGDRPFNVRLGGQSLGGCSK
jgi:hypothetical protein